MVSRLMVREQIGEEHRRPVQREQSLDRLVAQSIADIAANTTAGAVEIADLGADVLLRCVRTGTADTLEAFRHELLATCSALIDAQPSMAPLVNLVNGVLWHAEKSDSLRTMRLAVANEARDFKRRLRVHEAAIAEAVLPLLSEGATVITHSRSTTVRAALHHAQRAGRRFKVICAESRPGYEGRSLAAELAEYAIPVTLVVDTLAIAHVSEAQLVVIGADHLTASGLVNKVGTYALALAAQANQVPIYGLCGSEKFLPPAYHKPDQVCRPPEQVWEESPAAVEIENYYFDHTPLNTLSGIVTEQGVMTNTVIEGWLASIHLHPTLCTPCNS